MSYAITTRINQFAFEVYCVRCRKEFGTMTGDILQAAILHNLNKGGVMCPNCRKSSCTRCGTALAEGLENTLCVFCVWEDEARRQDKKAQERRGGG